MMPNRNGARGIHTAAMKGHVAVINSLIAKGECVDAVTNVSVNQAQLFNFRHFFNVPAHKGLILVLYDLHNGWTVKLATSRNPQDTLMTLMLQLNKYETAPQFIRAVASGVLWVVGL